MVYIDYSKRHSFYCSLEYRRVTRIGLAKDIAEYIGIPYTTVSGDIKKTIGNMKSDITRSDPYYTRGEGAGKREELLHKAFELGVSLGQ